MAELYHLSHFFEFLCGVYFGSIAIFNFLQKDATGSLFRNVEVRRVVALNAKTELLEYYKINLNANSGSGKVLGMAIKWFIWQRFEAWVVYPLFRFVNYLIVDIISKDGFFIKRFFPAFFYTGFFCIAVVLASGYEQISNNVLCKIGIDFMFVYLGIGSIIFQFWALIIFPFLVNRFAYLPLTLVNFIIVFILIGVTISYAHNPDLKFGLDAYYSCSEKDWLIVWTICIALIPLVFIFLLIVFVLTFWFLTFYFYVTTLKRFVNKDKVVQILKDLGRRLP